MSSHSNLSTDTASDNPDWANFVVVPNSATDFFYNCTNFNGDITNWNMTGVNSIRRMLRNTLFNQDISGWDVSSVITMQDCFRTSSAFNQNINAWTTTSLVSLRFTFLGNTVYNQPLDNWDTSSVTTMQETFKGATSFNQDLGGWNISSVSNCSGMISNTALSTANYDSLLIGWAAQAPSIQTGVTLSVGPQYSSAAVSARNVLTSTYSWTITDGGLI